ncbi:hypothetical protein Cflav_PD4752 [Pedosphaera parvula Ellin514]|uniref:Uncharacterized protein n=1 Tax=Pedosphaera parvula (strain Ellin514) TaxID=320771 RepID=B9XEJ8_PEDPL|nr:hypothetical protein Cflav_PD4752 [Pedosphaera parvula Ellin514]
MFLPTPVIPNVDASTVTDVGLSNIKADYVQILLMHLLTALLLCRQTQ